MFGINLFAWLRAQVREAVVAGVEDAVRDLHGDGQPVAAPEVLEALRGRMSLALPEPEKVKNGKK
jgi:hypothetical protein